MGLIENIISNFGADNFVADGMFKCVIFGESAGYFENVKSIKSYTPSKIVFCLKKGEVTVSGEKLYVKKYCSGDVAVCGKITKLERN